MDCLYERCRLPLESGWRFCPNCGTDQSPQLGRVLDCGHDYELEGPFCTLCGYDAEAPFGLQPTTRRYVGWLVFLLSLIPLFVIGIMAMARIGVVVRVASYFMLPCLAGVFASSRLLLPRRVERAR